MPKVKYLKREDFNIIYRLYSKQSWLCDKEDCLIDLLALCSNESEKKLLIDLLNDFSFLDLKLLNYYLGLIADFIVNESGFKEETTQISAITYDDEADSSQKILDHLKMPIFKTGWSNVKTVNRFGAIPRNFNAGKKQIIFVDEFVGSGKTILSRIKQLKNDIGNEFELKLCFVAGMEHGLKSIEKLGYEVFCPLRFPKGISDRYVGEELKFAEDTMLELELKLAENVNDHQLLDYSFGYNKAEALYSLESCSGNTPNSVFPIFWWPRDKKNNQRNTLLTRFEKGLK
ncbi:MULTISPECIES: hypothetical protein [unclassified Butyricimonas]|uniref:phosphoribosyltransferase-like protein n=1 Tax=unclassified Butyricimonas TaxID=2637652 RepID=UPI000B38ED53|nr:MULTISPECIES: hypothetical protein [unclassified Butyricimonas]OUN62354.1 hypothetical protein B5G13_19910 [Butyricimonas sp. An62]